MVLSYSTVFAFTEIGNQISNQINREDTGMASGNGGDGGKLPRALYISLLPLTPLWNKDLEKKIIIIIIIIEGEWVG